MNQAFQLRPQRRKLEAPGQERCAAMLRAYMPSEVWWCASLSGIKLNGAAIGAAIRGGLQPGAPDFSFIFPDGATRYIEMKFAKDDFTKDAPNGRLTAEQAVLQGYLGRKMRVCSSWDGVRPMKPILESWLALYSLRLLTERESLARYAAEREAARMAGVKKLRRKLERASV